MLQSLYIENIAVIEKTSIEFEDGLNVLTGETGAGKSILIDAICAILGERTSRDLVRTGTDKAQVSAVFESLSQEIVSLLEQLGYEPDEDGTLLLQRMIKPDGKGACKINGKPATISLLKKLGTHLINIHGQHDSQALLSAEKHIRYIDKVAQNEELLSQFTQCYTAFRKIEKELAETQVDTAQKEQQMDLLNYQINEIEQAEIEIGEMQELVRKRDIYANSEKVIEALNTAYSALVGDEEVRGARDLLTGAANELDRVSGYFEELQDTAAKLQDLSYELEDCTDKIRDSFSELEYDPRELDEIEERLDLLHRLSRKYGKTEEEILEFLENARKELEKIELSDERRERLEQERAVKFEEITHLAEKLSEARKKSLKQFVKRVTEELAFLDMPKVKFVADRRRRELCAEGIDQIEFLISVNPGEEPKPLSKIASGGELSRIMLAIKNVLAENDDVDTLIFDEIDTGVSGSAAQKIGLKLKEVAQNRQVICITHLAQIAAQADAHLLIQKNVQGERTYTEVTPLDHAGRVRELARIMGGIEITDLMLQNAEQMIAARPSVKSKEQ